MRYVAERMQIHRSTVFRRNLLGEISNKEKDLIVVKVLVEGESLCLVKIAKLSVLPCENLLKVRVKSLMD